MRKFTLATMSLLAALVVGTSAHAMKPLTCQSTPDQFGGGRSITIVQQGDLYISGFASGGRAQFVSKFGPNKIISKQMTPDSVTYTWVDQFDQVGHATIVSTDIEGQLVRTATTDFGMWAHVSMTCK